MKAKSKSIKSLIFICILLLSGCSDVKQQDIYHTVTFNTMCGDVVASQRVLHGEKIKKPCDLTTDGYVFKGWEYQNEIWSFAGYVCTEDMTLNAIWEEEHFDFDYGSYGINNEDVGYFISKYHDHGYDPKVYIPQFYKNKPVLFIARYAFHACTSLVSVTLRTNQSKIDSYGFYDCEKLQEIHLTKSIIDIRENAFIKCDSLSDIYYSGSEDDWKKIKIHEKNENLKNANVHFNAQHFEINTYK